MSLLDDFYSPCVLMEEKRISDGEGGYLTQWVEGMEFGDYSSLNTSTPAVVAERQGATSIYGVLVDRNLPLKYGDYYKKKDTGAVYRVTSHPDEKQAPKSASFSLKYFTAERTELPA